MGNGGGGGSRRGSRRSIRAAINDRKEMENMIQEQNNTNTNNLLGADQEGEVGRRGSRVSISKQGSSTGLKTDKESMRAFRKQTRMNTGWFCKNVVFWAKIQFSGQKINLESFWGQKCHFRFKKCHFRSFLVVFMTLLQNPSVRLKICGETRPSVNKCRWSFAE